METYQEFTADMSKSEKREIKNRLYVVIEHCLKVKYVKGRLAEANVRGWNNSVQRERRALAELFMEHPGLKPELTDELVDEVYRAAVAVVQVEYRNVKFPRLRKLSMEDIVGKKVMLVVMKN